MCRPRLAAHVAYTRDTLASITKLRVRGYRDNPDHAPLPRVVAGRVELRYAVPFTLPPDIAALYPPPSRTGEYRAGSARITDLQLVDEGTLRSDEAAALVKGLSSAYGVPVTWRYERRLQALARRRCSRAMTALWKRPKSARCANGTGLGVSGNSVAASGHRRCTTPRYSEQSWRCSTTASCTPSSVSSVAGAAHSGQGGRSTREAYGEPPNGWRNETGPGMSPGPVVGGAC